MAPPLTKDSVIDALKRISVSGGIDIVSSGVLSEIVINKNKVYFALNVPQKDARAYEPVRKAAEDAVKALPGVESAIVTLTADTKGTSAPQPAAGGAPDRGIGG